jgi:hypothetical protein
MKRLQKVVISSISIVILLSVLIIILTSPPTFIGYAVIIESCEGTISSPGLHELNDTVTCSSGNALILNSSNITLECNNNLITGAGDANSVAITINANLTNTSIQNCNISGFYDPIIVTDPSNFSIKNTYVVANNTCVTGDWTDNGGNTGCLDTTGPTIGLENQTRYDNETLKYTISTTDPSGVLNHSVSDTENFTINSSGFLSNASTLAIGNYSLNISASDTLFYNSTVLMNMEILQGVTPEPPEESSSNDDNDDSSSGGSPSGGSPSSNSPSSSINICGKDVAYDCTEWSVCENNLQDRTCTKASDECDDSLPATSQGCIPELIDETCEPNWDCTWTECDTNNIRQAIDCSDLNECNLPETIPIEETCEIKEESVILTGGAITALEKLKSYKNSIQTLKTGTITFIIIVFLVVGFVLTLVLSKKAKSKRKLDQPMQINKTPVTSTPPKKNIFKKIFPRNKDVKKENLSKESASPKKENLSIEPEPPKKIESPKETEIQMSGGAHELWEWEDEH